MEFLYWYSFKKEITMKYTHMSDTELVDKGRNQDANSLAYALATRLDSTLNDVYTLHDVLDGINNGTNLIGPVTFTATVYLQSKTTNTVIELDFDLPLTSRITEKDTIGIIKEALQAAPEGYEPLSAKDFFNKDISMTDSFALPANLNYDERLATSINELNV